MEETVDTLRILSQQRRLAIVTALKEADEPLTTDELAREVAFRELGIYPSELTESQLRKIRLSFHHVHLPKLVAADVVEYTPSGDTVRLTAESTDVQRIVDVVFRD
ncbi:DUF7344 domain-containing protein [Halogeometricum limi]|uniref:DUF7344 domain-containing protein n=1 Tax=Halogeometricum limi TaxID=555875 RepID=A0A1I6G5X5_9EURY|nr:permease [Halogeometricum limi]SFR37585.1 hypothetical protein SAMN04488124_0919 [Halogeometricum limi]